MPFPEWHPPFLSFSSFLGVWGAKPFFLWVECKFVIFASFVKTAPFWQGTNKNTVYQKHGLCHPDPQVLTRLFLRQRKVSRTPRPWEPLWNLVKERKRHITFFNIEHLAPSLKKPHYGPQKKCMCLISEERTQESGPCELLRGDWIKSGRN